MSEEDLLIQAQHPASKRYAILEDDGSSAWLYLTEPGEPKPVADAWVFNRVPAPSKEDLAAYRDGPPPAVIGFAGQNAQCADPTRHEWTLRWSSAGDCVAALKDGTPVAYIVGGQQRGYSRELLKDGPWGNVWSKEAYARAFEDKA